MCAVHPAKCVECVIYAFHVLRYSSQPPAAAPVTTRRNISVTHVTSSMRRGHMTSAARNWLQKKIADRRPGSLNWPEVFSSFLKLKPSCGASSGNLRGRLGKSLKLVPRTAARGAACDFFFFFFSYKNTLASNLGQSETSDDSKCFMETHMWVRDVGGKKSDPPPHPLYTSKGRSFILSIKAHYSTMIKAAAPRVAQSCWRN